MFLPMRSKKEKTEAERFAEIFEGEETLVENLRTKYDVSILHRVQLCECMKKAFPHYTNKVRPVAGGCELSKFGLGDSDRELLCQEVNIVFHIAATVRFDEKLKTAVYINVRSTKHLLELARLMPHLQTEAPALHRDVLISTAGTLCVLPASTSLLDQVQGHYTGGATVEVCYFLANRGISKFLGARANNSNDRP